MKELDKMAARINQALDIIGSRRIDCIENLTDRDAEDFQATAILMLALEEAGYPTGVDDELEPQSCNEDVRIIG